jgi:hypothetical protein
METYHEGDGDGFGDLEDAADHDDAIFESPELGLTNGFEDVGVKNRRLEAVSVQRLDQALHHVSRLSCYVVQSRLTKISQAQRSMVHGS